LAKLPVMQPKKTINRWRLQVDPIVMDLGDPVGSQMGFWGGNPINIFAFCPSNLPPISRPPINPVPEEENLADNLMLFG
jgi:hypothetical protein